MVHQRIVGRGGQQGGVGCPHLYKEVLVDEQAPERGGKGTFGDVDRMPSESGAFPYESTFLRQQPWDFS